jgi:hypothetical protein
MSFKEMLEKAKAAEALYGLTPKFFEFKKQGDMVLGRLKSITPVTSRISEGTYNQYVFETDDGNVKCFMGSVFDKSVGHLMKIGRVYMVTYEGKEKIKGGRSVNKFDVHLVGGEVDNEAPPQDDVPF